MSRKSSINFSGDLEKIIKSKANKILKNGVDYTCPSCGKKIKISDGKNKCKYCGTVIDFKGRV
ncbi:MAG: zinc ribbon domain-containing protein [Enterococcus canintestini]|uniref:zinc ribbon domain-containing protein n=1 Tax=Enterococcus TaxID=1350 RepID=UPI00249F5FF9|nr:zinc ribbon domain-containing protein [Enterococcus montenegrensis]WHA08820.1 zinc ribbon domain-containing protein [Enterococcus montenegrensis]